MTTVYGNSEIMMTLPDVSTTFSFGPVESHMIKTKTTPVQYITNCPNCGAPMKNHKCIYCGTEDYGRR